MAAVVLDVFQKKNLGLVILGNAQNLIEEGATGIFKTLLLSRNTKGLARKTAAK